jgi:hypothetical protein
VQNDTIRYASTQTPCAVICPECARVPKKWEEYRKVGGRASVFDYIVVFADEGALVNSDNNQALVQVGADSTSDERQK